MKPISLVACGVTAACLWIAGGCIKVDYHGQTFPALAPGQYVQFFGVDKPLPNDTFKMIGVARLSANDGTPEEDFRAKLEDLADEHGADAVKVVSYQRELVGVNNMETRDARDFNPTEMSTPFNDGQFGDRIDQETITVERYRIVVVAQLLAFSRRFDTVMDERKEERQEELQRYYQSLTPERPVLQQPREVEAAEDGVGTDFAPNLETDALDAAVFRGEAE